jgi:hypothetical protein
VPSPLMKVPVRQPAQAPITANMIKAANSIAPPVKGFLRSQTSCYLGKIDVG